MTRILLRAALLSLGLVLHAAAAADSPLAASEPDSSVLTNLHLNADVQSYDAKFSDTNAQFKFDLTNAWTNELTVDRVQTSCGCTVASLPSNPWHIPGGAHGEVGVTVDLLGKGAGLLEKTVTFYVSANSTFLGTKVCTVKVKIPEPPAPEALTPAERLAAMAKAKADPQRVFTDPKCAACHADRGRDKMGRQLYGADCGICHDSPNRESSVPDLHKLKVPTSFAYWKEIIANGKPHTMMPAFDKSKGGPLSDDQIHTLAEYLNRTYTSQASQSTQ